jgi:hypothetical protein
MSDGLNQRRSSHSYYNITVWLFTSPLKNIQILPYVFLNILYQTYRRQAVVGGWGLKNNTKARLKVCLLLR